MGGLDNRERLLEVIESADRFAELTVPWEKLADREPTPFGSHMWLSAWWNAFGASRGLRMLVLWEGGEMVATYPLYADAGGLSAMANVHSPLYRPLARDQTSLRDISTAALRHVRGHLIVEALPQEDPALAELRRAAREAHAHTLCSDLRVSPIVDTTGDFASWRAGSRPRWGAPLERFRRKMLRENGAEIRVVLPPERLESELERGFAVEASGWKGKAGTAINSAASTAQFYGELSRSAHARDELRLSTITLDGELAAFDLTLLRHGRLFLLKTGFDERYRRLAPGLVLRLSVIERCFELGLSAHELLGDDSEWKRKFSTSSRSHVTIDIYGNRPRPRATYAGRGARQALARARAVKSVPNTNRISGPKLTAAV
jgi:CelD/BcsL family acetyltransferase involved in cellulose biosynthesis